MSLPPSEHVRAWGEGGGKAKKYDFTQRERRPPDFARTLERQSAAELRAELALGKGGDDYLEAVRAALAERGAARS